MKRRSKLASLGLLIQVLCLPANAGPYGDALTRCLNDKTSKEDRAVLIQWIIVAFASHPVAKGFVSVQSNSIPVANAAMAAYTERLFLQDCLLEAREAARYEGEIAVAEAFKFVASSAGREVMADPSVSQIMNGYIGSVDGERFEREIFGN